MSSQRYHFQHRLGEGHNGKVYRARRKSDGALVAVKTFTSEGGDFGSFEIERHAYALLQRADIHGCNAFVAIIEHIEDQNRPCLVFPMLGCTLRSVLRTSELLPLPLADALTMLHQLVDGIQFLHQISIIHTDIKPENIMLVSADTVRREDGAKPALRLVNTSLRIIDLADAKFGPGDFYGLAGTEQYRAPELTLGIQWTTAIDWFSLGCVFTEILIGRPLFPYMAESLVARLAALRQVLGGLPRDIVEMTSGRFGSALIENVDGTYDVLFARGNTRDAIKRKQVSKLVPLQGVVDPTFLPLCTLLLALDPTKRCHPADEVREQLTNM